ncbi:kinase domain protein [Oesophagostomum dentatum]|uniref:Kinase domain protein n=1 Tax=Oesophagostomum dentatum TaxID=61180 RepID=A0A0B1SVR2_OESDE|nr:kinase domain protein [Oesophagostomum dentatum]
MFENSTVAKKTEILIILDEIVALKRLKIEKEREGFPITALREINMLLKAGKHENIVNVKEILIGSSADKIYLAMEFVEHDMKSLMDTMHKRGKRFTFGEQKTLMRQLLSGLKHLHDNWILHRDLKTSNLLFSHKGILKIADFGLAREYGDPLRPYTAIVVTLWYRAPELLLGQKVYSTPIDLWSVGCIMGEFVLLKPLFPGSGEQDEISKIFKELGTPSDAIWEGYSELPGPKLLKLPEHPYNQLRKKFPASLMNESGFKLLNRFLTYDPVRRITAEEALNDRWFLEDPKPTPPEMFPTFPAKSEQHRAPPPSAAMAKKKPEIINPERAKLLADLKVRPDQVTSGSFSLKFDKTRF